MGGLGEGGLCKGRLRSNEKRRITNLLQQMLHCSEGTWAGRVLLVAAVWWPPPVQLRIQ